MSSSKLLAERIARLWWRVVQFGFRLLYNEMAFTYDMVSWLASLGAWHCWQRSALKYVPDDVEIVLELAHGTGNMQIDLKDVGYKTVGYDLSPNMGRITQRKLFKDGKDAALVRGRAQALPFPDAAFDAVICTFPTSFIFAEGTLREVRRILADDGVMVVVLNGTLQGTSILRRFIEWVYRITGQRGNTDVGILDEYINYVDSFGFETALFEEPCIRRTTAQGLIIRKKD